MRMGHGVRDEFDGTCIHFVTTGYLVRLVAHHPGASSDHITSCYVMLFVMLCVMLYFYHVLSYNVIWYHVVSSHITWCHTHHAMSYFIIRYYITSWTVNIFPPYYTLPTISIHSYTHPSILISQEQNLFFLKNTSPTIIS